MHSQATLIGYLLRLWKAIIPLHHVFFHNWLPGNRLLQKPSIRERVFKTVLTKMKISPTMSCYSCANISPSILAQPINLAHSIFDTFANSLGFHATKYIEDVWSSASTELIGQWQSCRVARLKASAGIDKSESERVQAC